MPRREKNRWTAAENALLIEHYNTATPQQLEAMFPNHTLTRIKDHATWLRKNGTNIPVRKPTSGGDETEPGPKRKRPHCCSTGAQPPKQNWHSFSREERCVNAPH